MPRPIILGVVGDSAAGKTTLTRGLVRILGEDGVNHIGTDDYHRYDRKQRSERGITPLDPDCNYLDVMTHDLGHVRSGEAILKPVYQHADGTFGPPEYVEPKPFAVVEGLLGYHAPALCDVYDLRVFLAPPEELRRRWKVQRDCSRRGYTTDQVLAELDRREPDSEEFIRPQERKADLVVSFTPREGGSPESLDAELVLRKGLSHPDLEPILGDRPYGITITDSGRERRLSIPGDIDTGRADEVEAAIWERMRFASHLNTQRLGEFTIGTDLHRSNSLAIVQVLIVYHLVTAKASVALGGDGGRAADESATSAPEGRDEAGDVETVASEAQ